MNNVRNHHVLLLLLFILNLNCSNNDRLLEEYLQIDKYLYYKKDISVLADLIANSCVDLNDNNLFEYSECSIDSIFDENNDGIINPLEIGVTEWGINRRLIVLFAPNRGLSGLFPESIWNLKKLIKLDLRNNQLTGEIPIGIENASEIEEIWLDNNYLSGHIYSEFNLLKSLEILSLKNNEFTSISNDICNTINSLSHYVIDGNQICNIVELSQCTVDIIGTNQDCP